MVNIMTNAELAILGLVADEPRHGYEIERVIEERGMRDWTEVGFSSIYYLLKKLERAGYVESELEEAARGPARKVYRASPSGEEALRTGVLDALSVPKRCYLPLQLGLSHLPGIPTGEAIAALGQYHDALAERRAYVSERWQRQKPLPLFVEAMFEHSLTMIEAELSWVKDFIEKLEVQDVQG
jgi:DNA-binding PadR family transcriptional regulator